MQVFKNAPVADGDTDWASVTVRINDDQIYVAQIQVTIRDDLNETIYDKVSLFRQSRVAGTIVARSSSVRVIARLIPSQLPPLLMHVGK